MTVPQHTCLHVPHILWQTKTNPNQGAAACSQVHWSLHFYWPTAAEMITTAPAPGWQDFSPLSPKLWWDQGVKWIMYSTAASPTQDRCKGNRRGRSREKKEETKGMCQCSFSVALGKETPARYKLELIASVELHFYFFLKWSLCFHHVVLT